MHDTPATILVAEDDAPTRTFLADELTADGYDLLVADCAKDALRLLETKFPDLAIVDVGLPDASGLEVVRRVREADGVSTRIDPATPLILLSGRCGEVDRVRGFDRGAAAAAPPRRRRRRGRPRPRLRPGGRRLRRQAVLLPGAARPRRRAAAPVRRPPPHGPGPRRRAGDRSRLAHRPDPRPAGRPD